jgi:addiction module RelE/StbE family toxin
MIIRYDPGFIAKYKKQDVRIRKSLKEIIALFVKDPKNPRLNNHALRDEWKGYRSINVTSDYRAIYIGKDEGDEIIAYFVEIGAHSELYKF